MSEAKRITTISPEKFSAMYAPESFDIPALHTTAHEMVMEKLSESARKLIESSYYYWNNPRDLCIKVEFNNSGADCIRSQERAGEILDCVTATEKALKDALQKVEAMKEYYTQTAALLAATEKVSTVYLSRNDNHYGSKKVTYELHTGYYDKTLKNHVITGWRVAQYTGKDHRNARAHFEQLVKSTPGTLGYEISNNYKDHLGYDNYTIKS